MWIPRLLVPTALVAAIPLAAVADIPVTNHETSRPVEPLSIVTESRLGSVSGTASVDIFPSQTCWDQRFDITISGVTGDLQSSCYDDSLIDISIAIWEKDGGWLDPDDRVRELWLVFPTNGLTAGVPYSHTFADVDLFNWCDEWDYVGEFYVEVKGPCLAATLVSPKEDVALLFYPTAPGLVTPATGSQVAGQPVTLQWNGIYGANTYQVQVDDDNTFATPVADEQSGGLQVPISGLVENNTYYWRVRGHNNTCGDGPWSAIWNFSFTPTAVSEIEAPTLPKEFALGRNYPNPFNPSTRMTLALPRSAHVTLEVYNVVGRKVRRLVDERLSAGFKVVTWDGNDDDGNAVATGVYVYRMTAGEFESSRKMLLLK